MVDDDYVERATTLDSTDAPQGTRLDNSETKQDYYRRLAVLNSLDYNGKWRDERRETAKNASAIVDAVAGSLSLTPFQKAEAHRRFAALPDKYNQSYPTSLVAVCVCGVVGAEDGREYSPKARHPDAAVDGWDYRWYSVVQDTGVSYSEFHSCWESIKAEVGD